MRTKFGAFWLGILALLAPTTVLAQSAIRWEPNLEIAKQRAAQSGRLVLVHFWADWCRSCKVMDREVFSRREVASALEANYVCVKVNTDFRPQTGKQFGIVALPTDVILSPNGQQVAKFTGGASPGDYIAKLTQVAQSTRQGAPTHFARGPQTPPPPTGGAYQPPAFAQNPVGQPPVAPPPMHQPPMAPPPMVPPPVTQPPFSQPPAGQFALNQPPAGQPGAAMAPVAPGYGDDRRPVYPPNPQPSPSLGMSPGGPFADRGAPSPQPPTEQRPWENPMVVGVAPPPAVAPPVAPPMPPPAAPPTMAPGGMAQGGDWPGQPREPTVGAPRQPDPQPGPAGNPPLGLDGCCPVQLCDDMNNGQIGPTQRKWTLGNRQWGVIHRGRTYLFSSPENAGRFQAQPDRYAPILSGNDVVMAVDEHRSVEGRRDYGAFFGNQIYLFANESSLARFEQAPNRYADYAQQTMRQSGPSPEVGGRPPAETWR